MKPYNMLFVAALLSTTMSINAGDTMPKVPAEMMPSKDIMDQAKAVVDALSAPVKKDQTMVTVSFPAAYVELMQNTFTMSHEMTSKDIQDMMMMHAAYENPYDRSLVEQAMGKDAKFMAAYNDFMKTLSEYNAAWNTLRNDVHTNVADEIANAKSGANMSPSDELKKIIEMDAKGQKQLAELRAMIKQSNPKLEEHMKKLEYLGEQVAKWGIAFAMAANSDIKDVSTKKHGQVKEAIKSIFRYANVNEAKDKAKAVGH